eukprot:GHRR01011988.1.p1 GENE.GHRR01011988.1~~GHRR01011988.1.p1  ORF type:complete len:100 (+),score=4.40 GHRR01011988.1:230-529(+)
MDASSLLARELGKRQTHACHMPEGVARKLTLEGVLSGHGGCVNRVAWNEDGSMLASASDDCQVGKPGPAVVTPALVGTSGAPRPQQNQGMGTRSVRDGM